jgi:hypothetical protein
LSKSDRAVFQINFNMPWYLSVSSDLRRDAMNPGDPGYRDWGGYPQMNFNRYMYSDVDAFRLLVAGFVNAILDRLLTDGVDMARKEIYWEIFNEPQLYWRGSLQDMMTLYKETAETVKATVDAFDWGGGTGPNHLIGGMAPIEFFDAVRYRYDPNRHETGDMSLPNEASDPQKETPMLEVLIRGSDAVPNDVTYEGFAKETSTTPLDFFSWHAIKQGSHLNPDDYYHLGSHEAQFEDPTYIGAIPGDPPTVFIDPQHVSFSGNTITIADPSYIPAGVLFPDGKIGVYGDASPTVNEGLYNIESVGANHITVKFAPHDARTGFTTQAAGVENIYLYRFMWPGWASSARNACDAWIQQVSNRTANDFRFIVTEYITHTQGDEYEALYEFYVRLKVAENEIDDVSRTAWEGWGEGQYVAGTPEDPPTPAVIVHYDEGQVVDYQNHYYTCTTVAGTGYDDDGTQGNPSTDGAHWLLTDNVSEGLYHKALHTPKPIMVFHNVMHELGKKAEVFADSENLVAIGRTGDSHLLVEGHPSQWDFTIGSDTDTPYVINSIKRFNGETVWGEEVDDSQTPWHGITSFPTAPRDFATTFTGIDGGTIIAVDFDFTPTPADVPGPPTDVTASPDINETVALAWNAPTDVGTKLSEFTPGGLTNYRVTIRDKATQTTQKQYEVFENRLLIATQKILPNAEVSTGDADNTPANTFPSPALLEAVSRGASANLWFYAGQVLPTGQNTVNPVLDSDSALIYDGASLGEIPTKLEMMHSAGHTTEVVLTDIESDVAKTTVGYPEYTKTWGSLYWLVTETPPVTHFGGALPTWQTSKNYYVNDTVLHSGVLYDCTAQHWSTTGNEPPSTEWTVHTASEIASYEGKWSSSGPQPSGTYEVNDAVYDDTKVTNWGYWYVCKTQHSAASDKRPGVSSGWEAFWEAAKTKAPVEYSQRAYSDVFQPLEQKILSAGIPDAVWPTAPGHYGVKLVGHYLYPRTIFDAPWTNTIRDLVYAASPGDYWYIEDTPRPGYPDGLRGLVFPNGPSGDAEPSGSWTYNHGLITQRLLDAGFTPGESTRLWCPHIYDADVRPVPGETGLPSAGWISPSDAIAARLISLQGAWISNQPYAVRDGVDYGGNLYVSKTSHSNTTPPDQDATNWVLWNGDTTGKPYYHPDYFEDALTARNELGRLWVLSLLEAALFLAGGDPELVCPVVWHRLHQQGGDGTRWLLPDEEFIYDQIAICRDLGITRFSLWGKPVRVMRQNTNTYSAESLHPTSHPVSAAYTGQVYSPLENLGDTPMAKNPDIHGFGITQQIVDEFPDGPAWAGVREQWFLDVLPRHLTALLLENIAKPVEWTRPALLGGDVTDPDLVGGTGPPTTSTTSTSTLAVGVEHEVIVEARNSHGYSLPSTPEPFTPQTLEPPAQPTLTEISHGTTSVSFNLSLPAAPPSVTHSRLEHQKVLPTPGGWSTIIEWDPASDQPATYSHSTGITPGDVWRYRLVHSNFQDAVEQPAYSDEVEINFTVTGRIIPGGGWGTDVTAGEIATAEIKVGDPFHPDFATKVPGFINVVPFQDVSAPFEIGALCTARQGFQGIDKVEFQADAGAVLSVTTMSENTRTGDWEFHATVDPNDFAASGWTQIRVRGVPNDGQPRLFSYNNTNVSRNTEWYQLDLYINKDTVHEDTWTGGSTIGNTDEIEQLRIDNGGQHGGTTIIIPDDVNPYTLDLSSLDAQTYESNGRNARWFTIRAETPGGVKITNIIGAWDGHIRLDGISLPFSGLGQQVGCRAVWWSGDESDRTLTYGTWNNANAYYWIIQSNGYWDSNTPNGVPYYTQGPEHGLYCTGVTISDSGSTNQANGIMFDRRTKRNTQTSTADIWNQAQYVNDVLLDDVTWGNPPSHTDVIESFFAIGWNQTGLVQDNLCIMNCRLISDGQVTLFSWGSAGGPGIPINSIWFLNNIIATEGLDTNLPNAPCWEAGNGNHTSAPCQVIFHHNTFLNAQHYDVALWSDRTGSAFIGNCFSLTIDTLIDTKCASNEIIAYGNINQGANEENYAIWSGTGSSNAYQDALRAQYPNVALPTSNMDPLANGSYSPPPAGGLITQMIGMQNVDFHPGDPSPAASHVVRMWPVDRRGEVRASPLTAAGALIGADEGGTLPAVLSVEVAGSAVADDGTHDYPFGITSGNSVPLTVEVFAANADINITSAVVTGDGSSSDINLIETTILQDTSGSFTLDLDATLLDPGPHSTTVTLDHDSGDGSFVFNVSYTVLAIPTAYLTVDVDGTPAPRDSIAELGSVLRNDPLSAEITLTASGTTDLVLGTVTVTGAFSDTSNTLPASLAPGNSASFTVVCTTGVEGTDYSIDINIPSNDEVYDFDLEYDVLVPPSLVIDVDGIPISDGGTHPLGDITEGFPLSVVTNIDIVDAASGDVILNDVSVTGTPTPLSVVPNLDGLDLSLSTPSRSYTTTFQTSTTSGLKTITHVINSDSQLTPSITFYTTYNVLPAPTGTLTVAVDGIDIADEEAIALGDINLNDSVQITVTLDALNEVIELTGLSVDSDPLGGIADETSSGLINAEITPGTGGVEYTITLETSAQGSFTITNGITHNGGNDNPFEFSITFTVVVPEDPSIVSPLIPAEGKWDEDTLSFVAPEPDELWAPNAIPLPNWKSPIGLSSTYRTISQASRSSAETRIGLAAKPARAMTFNLRGYGEADTERVRHILARMTRARTPMPLYCDISRLTAKPDITQTTYSGDFSNRRFYVGSRIVAIREDRAGIATHFTFATIVAVSDTSITLNTDLTETYATPPTIASHFADSSGTFSPSDTATHATPVSVRKGDVVVSSIGYTTTDVAAYSIFNARADAFSMSFLQGFASVGGQTSRLAVAWWQATQDGSFIIRWDLSTPVVWSVSLSNTVITGAHPDDPVGQFQVDPDASTSQWASGLTLDHDTAIPGQRSIVIHGIGCNLPADNGYYNLDPDATPDADVLSSGSGAADSPDFWHGVSTADLSDATASFTQEFYGSNVNDTNQVFLAGGLVINPIEEHPSLVRQYIYPVIESDLELERVISAITDQVSDASITVIETPGKTALVPSVTVGDAPPNTTTYDGHPILSLPINWTDVRIGTFRIGKRTKTGLTHTVQVFGDYPGARFTLPFFTYNREDFHNLLEFFDSRGGRLHPFWLMSPASGIRVDGIGIDDDTLFLEVRGTDIDWEVFTHIGIIDNDGTQSIHEITASVESNGQQVVVVTPDVPSTPLAELTFQTAHLCRFDTDELVEQWITDEDTFITLPAKELLDERNIAVTHMDVCGSTSGGPYWKPVEDPTGGDGGYDPCTGIRCGSTNPGGCCVCATTCTTTVRCFVNDCDPFADNPCDNCRLLTTCTDVLTAVSCIAGEVRWESSVTGGWAELNTTTGQWTYDLGTLLSGEGCCEDVNPGTLTCTTCGDSYCEGEPEFVDTHGCDGFTRQRPCSNFESDGECGYVTTLSIIPEGSGPGDPLCG